MSTWVYYFLMMDAATSTEYVAEVRQRYRSNFARHLLGVSLYLQSEIMRTLTEQCGHSALRINYEPYIAIIGTNGARLSDIADLLGISRQAANQTANQIEAAGYIERKADPSDGRAKLLIATRQGLRLRKDGAREAARLQAQMIKIAGHQAINATIGTLGRLNSQLGLLLVPGHDTGFEEQAQLGGLLPRLSDYTRNRLMLLTAARGHPDLKLSFGQVLTAIGPGGGRIQHIADAQGVSKQAISATANELEELDYIRRVPDPSDARQVLLHFTDKGLGLIADSVASVDDLLAEFADLVGITPLKKLGTTLQALYRALHLEEDIFGNTAPVDIRVLAQQLTKQLGEEGTQALGRLLLSRDNITV